MHIATFVGILTLQVQADLPGGQRLPLLLWWTTPGRPSGDCHLLYLWPLTQHPVLSWWSHLHAIVVHFCKWLIESE